MTDPIFVDTNVWVHAVDAADPAKRQRALEVTAPAQRCEGREAGGPVLLGATNSFICGAWRRVGKVVLKIFVEARAHSDDDVSRWVRSHSGLCSGRIGWATTATERQSCRGKDGCKKAPALFQFFASGNFRDAAGAVEQLSELLFGLGEDGAQCLMIVHRTAYKSLFLGGKFGDFTSDSAKRLSFVV